VAAQWLASATAGGGREPPPLPLRQLLAPAAPLSEAGADAVAKITAGVRDPVRPLIKSLAKASAIPLIPVIAALSAWRRHLGQFPAAAPLSAELQGIMAEAGTELERRQARFCF
jgi:hypothetical protein